MMGQFCLDCNQRFFTCQLRRHQAGGQISFQIREKLNEPAWYVQLLKCNKYSRQVKKWTSHEKCFQLRWGWPRISSGVYGCQTCFTLAFSLLTISRIRCSFIDIVYLNSRLQCRSFLSRFEPILAGQCGQSSRYVSR